MKTLYIIGNGFDKAHKIMTDYWDFRIFLDRCHPEFLHTFEKQYGFAPLDDSEPWYSESIQEKWAAELKQELWSELESTMGFPDITEMTDFSESVVGNLNLEAGNIGIRDTMDYYWKQEYGYVNLLQGYVKEWAEQIDIGAAYPLKDCLLENKNDLFLNFNYTKTLETVYHIDGANILHVHGAVGEGAETNPIMGHCNQVEIEKHYKLSREADDDFDEGTASIHEAIANYLKALFKDTEKIISYHEDFFNHLKEVKQVVIIGWSMGDVDIPYLRKVRECVRSEAKWIVIFHKKNKREYYRKVLAENGINNAKLIQANTYWDRE